MKINRHGKAAILSADEIQLLFNEGLTTERDRTLFAICLFSGCRIAESCSLLTADVYDKSGRVRAKFIIRKANSKGKLATRTIPVFEELRGILSSYSSIAGSIYLFPGRLTGTSLKPDSADDILRKACERVGLQGVSTHSFRRSAITHMSNSLVPLRVIQEVSGHRDLGQLQKYIEVADDQVLGAIASLSLLAPAIQKIPNNLG